MDLVAALRSFLRVVETGSFSAVAAERGLTQPAISRQISALEEHLGARLVQRSTQAITLTDEGRTMLASAQDVVDSADALLNSTSHRRSRPVGLVRVGVPVPLGLFLSKRIDELLAQHTELSVELVMRDRFINLVEEGLDFTVHVGEVDDLSHIARRVGFATRLVVAAPTYLNGKRLPTHPSDLVEHDCIVHHREGNDDVWWFHPEGSNSSLETAEVSVTVRGRFSANNAVAVHLATLAGKGIACVSQAMVENDVKAGNLVVLLGTKKHLPFRTRAVIDWIVNLHNGERGKVS